MSNLFTIFILTLATKADRKKLQILPRFTRHVSTNEKTALSETTKLELSYWCILPRTSLAHSQPYSQYQVNMHIISLTPNIYVNYVHPSSSSSQPMYASLFATDLLSKWKGQGTHYPIIISHCRARYLSQQPILSIHTIWLVIRLRGLIKLI